MNEAYLEHSSLIEHHIANGHAFALYRLPGEDRYTLLVQTNGEGVQTYHTLKELNKQQGFVIAPFEISPECPVVLIQPDTMHQYPLPEIGELNRFESSRIDSVKIESDVTLSGGRALHESESATTESDLMVKEQALESILLKSRSDLWEELYPNDTFLQKEVDESYATLFADFINALHEGLFEKLVLSRASILPRDGALRLMETFLKACRCYIHSYVYLCYTPQTGAWLGSTPEILLSGIDEQWQTVALAGTQSLDNGQLPQQWDEKNRQEQEVVAAYIRSQLASLGITTVEHGPYPVYAGALSHLKSDFKFTLPDRSRLGELLALLHPTPAVCGFPKAEAYRFILSHENHRRRYYSGFVGWLTPEGKTDLYVNLRCMQLAENSLTLYAGGGLLPSSELADEWLETEKKLQTMKRMINFG